MQPSSQENNQNPQETQINRTEPAQTIDSDIKKKKLQCIKELEDSQHDDSRRLRPKFSEPQIKKKSHLKFAPFRSRTLRIPGIPALGCAWIGSGSSFYNKKHNLIMICPINTALYFYDATTLLPPEGREVLQLGYGNILAGVSFCSETDTFLFACQSGDLLAYDFNKKILETVQMELEKDVSVVTFINSTYYAFSIYFFTEIFVGNLKDGSLLKVGSGKALTCFLQKLEKKNLLLSALANGVMRIYRTDCLPKLPVICSVRAYQGGEDIRIERINFKRKDFMITSESANGILKVWHLFKGKVRLLRVIDTGEMTVCSCNYLANYKMIATTHESESIKFFSLFSGKLKYEYSARFNDAFLMEDKNELGVTDFQREVIEIIQLHPQPENDDGLF